MPSWTKEGGTKSDALTIITSFCKLTLVQKEWYSSVIWPSCSFCILLSSSTHSIVVHHLLLHLHSHPHSATHTNSTILNHSHFLHLHLLLSLFLFLLQLMVFPSLHSFLNRSCNWNSSSGSFMESVFSPNVGVCKYEYDMISYILLNRMYDTLYRIKYTCLTYHKYVVCTYIRYIRVDRKSDI